MDYSKLNNISASLQDVENATSIVENKLKDLIEQIERNAAISLNDLNDKSVQKDKDGNVIILKKNEFNINNTKHINKKIKIRFIDDIDSFVSKYIEIMKATSEEEITPEAENEYKQSLYAESEGFKLFVIDNKEYQNLIIDKVYDSNNNLIDEASITEVPGLGVFSKESPIVANTDYYVNDFYTINESFINIFDLKKSGSLYLFGVGNYSGESDSNDNSNEESENPKSVQEVINDLNDKIDNFAQTASDIPYNDSVSHMNVSNVQQAIQNLAVGISGGFSNVTITLKTNGEQPIANQEVTIAVTYQGETYDLTTQSSYNNGFASDSNGHIALHLPLGAVYQISFHQYNINYSTPDTLNGIIDKPICNLTGLYVALSDNEAVLINVDILNTRSSTTPNNKEVYIDYYNSGSWIHSYTAVLSSVGTPKTIKDTQENVIKSGDNYVTVDIPKNTQFRVRLQLWDTSLTEEEQIYIASSNISKIASNARSIINMSYTYALPGLYLIIKDSTTEKGYAEYKILNVDSTNNTMEITINGINYTLSKDSNNNIYRKETNSSDSPAQWFTQSSSSDILGVGIRSSSLISKPMNDEFTYNLGYTNCCFRVSRNFIEFNGQITTTGSPNVVTYSNVDGMFQTRKLASFSESQTFPSAQKAIDNYKQTLNTSNGSVTIDGFIPATSQMEIFRSNYPSLMFILPFINGTTLYSPYKNNINYDIGCSNNVDATTIGASTDNYRKLKGNFERGSSGVNTSNTNFFVFYPF